MRTLITGGGELSSSFLKEYLRKNHFDYLIAADAGLDPLLKAGFVPDLILGDYDSTEVPERISELRNSGVPVRVYPCEKDFSDTESALHAAVDQGSSEIVMLGMCGGRLDHFLANVMDLLIPLRKGITARIVNEQNEIFLADQSFELKKSEREATYVSLLPFTGEVRGVKLTGFKYELDGTGRLSKESASFGISNEFAPGINSARVEFESGILIVVLSKDRKL